MKLGKSMMLMALGCASAIMYKKYSRPLMKKMSRMLYSMDNELEDLI